MDRREVPSETWRMMEPTCTKCGSTYPKEGMPYVCPHCGGLYDFQEHFPYDPTRVDQNKPGIWRFEHTFGLPPNSEPVSLSEGNTPLVWAEFYGREIGLKCEFQNPSGSFKDRGSSVITAWMRARNISGVVEDSSGNAGASLAAYAARAGIKARIFVPESAAGPKRRQIEAYGAELVPVAGSREKTADAARSGIGSGYAYASHAYLPFNLPGYATTSYEIFEQLGNQLPGTVVMPAGQGGLLLGMARGFDALRIAINSKVNTSRLVGVQAKACAPLWERFINGDKANKIDVERKTLAEGVRVANPIRAEAVLQAVTESGGTIFATDESEIIPNRNELAHSGFYVEPTSAIVMSALKSMVENLPEPIVVVLTGSGYKYDQN